MSTPSNVTDDGSGRYEIRLRGHLQSRWSAWFEGMTLITEPDGTTVVLGPVLDQAALQGLLRKISDMGVQLISVTPVGPDAAHATSAESD
jgi:hypothetical protein